MIYAVHGWGKTSLTAQFPNAVFIPTEDGLDTLIDNKQLRETPHFPLATSWNEILADVDALIDLEHSFKALVIDVIDGCEALCHKFVCDRDFGGDWGKKGFASYMQGYDASLPEWRGFLARLDKLRIEKKMAIFGLCHTKIRTFKNPLGMDYDRYVPNIHEKTWCVTADWADVILFGNYEVVVSGEKGANKGKGIGGQVRMMYTQNNAAYDAKNRLGLPPEIEMGNSPQEAWANFVAALKAGREASNGQ